MRLSARALLAASVVASLTSLASAITVDGVIDSGYGAPVKVYTDQYVNGTDASGGVNTVSTYFTYDDNFVYAAAHLDSGTAAFAGANFYIYSGSANNLYGTGTPGTYGDGNDILAEGQSTWGYGQPTPPYKVGSFAYDPATVNYVYNAATQTAEISIARSLLGNYDSFRFGGQLFAYEFHTGGDRVDGAIVSVGDATITAAAPVPLPTAAFATTPLLALTALRRRR